MSSLGTFRNLYCIISKAMRSGRFFSRTGSILAQSARKAGRNTPLNVNLLAQARHALDPNSAKTLLLGAALVAGLAVPLLGNASEPFEDIEAGASTDFVEGEMKQIQVGPDKENDIIIVFRVDGQLYATGAKCSHFGAPLAQGAFFGNIVVCPWHLAGFNVKTGAIENGPASDGIPTYEVREENGKVIVKAPKKITVNTKALPTVARDPNNKQRYVIIGGGPAGASAAEALRQSGFTGEILLLTAEDHLPYDRSALTKNLFKVQPDKIAIRGASAYESLGIEVRTGQLVTSLDPKKKEIVTKGGQSISYDKVLIATGGSPVKLNVPGANLQNIAAIRDFTDVNYIKNAVAAGAKEIVIVGGGLIGAEAASNIKLDFGDKVNVTVVSRHGILENHFGAEVSAAFEKLAKENGVHVVHDHVAAFKGDSTVTEVSLKSGQSVKADLVIQAVGVKPNTWFIKDGVQLDSDGGVNADPFLRSSTDKDVYAAGDVVSFPFHYTAERIRFEHLTEAYGLGFHAAWNMLGKMVPYGNIPFYWTRQYNKSVACVGHLKGYDRIIVDGKPTDYNFCAYYIKGNKVIGAAGMMRGKDLMTLSHAMRVGVPVTTDHFKGTALDLQAVAGSFKSKKCACNRAGHSAAPPKA